MYPQGLDLIVHSTCTTGAGIFETERYAYYHKHGDVRLCTVMVSSMAFEAGISMELEVSNG